jgi:RimJ/RimL family protein N-acetyltransferase
VSTSDVSASRHPDQPAATGPEGAWPSLTDHPPAEIHLVGQPGLLLRRWRAQDASPLAAAVIDSLESLSQFMPWAMSGYSVGEAEEHISFSAASWDAGTEFNYGVWLGDQVVGACGLMTRPGGGGLEIGYWTRSDYQKQAIATRVTTALIEAAFGLPAVAFLVIRHDVANKASETIARKLSFARSGTEPGEPYCPGESGPTAVWRLTREDFVIRR